MKATQLRGSQISVITFLSASSAVLSTHDTSLSVFSLPDTLEHASLPKSYRPGQPEECLLLPHDPNVSFCSPTVFPPGPHGGVSSPGLAIQPAVGSLLLVRPDFLLCSVRLHCPGDSLQGNGILLTTLSPSAAPALPQSSRLPKTSLPSWALL